MVVGVWRCKRQPYIIHIFKNYFLPTTAVLKTIAAVSPCNINIKKLFIFITAVLETIVMVSLQYFFFKYLHILSLRFSS